MSGPDLRETQLVTSGWLRLDPRMLAVAPAQEIVRFVPLLIAALIAGSSQNRQWWLLGALGLAVGVGVLRWLTTRYRITAERIELRSGLLFRQHRSVPRDRVRTVDVTAKLLHRIFGLSLLHISAGQRELGKSAALSLDAVSAAEAERLRALLLDRSTVDPVAPESTVDTTAAPPAGAELARLHWSWLRFAPLTVLTVASVGAVLGGAWQLLSEAGIDIGDVGAVRGVVESLSQRPLGIAVAAGVGLLLAVGAVGALALYVEAWWGYRLTREPDGTLRVNRGLLTRRSVSLEERRLRGAEVEEPLLLRAGRGARLNALATGTGGGDRSHLMPPAPRTVVHRTAAAVLREPTSPTTRRLRRHPAAAFRRRMVRAMWPAVAVVAGLAIAGRIGTLPQWAWVWAAAVLLPASALLGLDRYRNLGHELTEDYLVVRSGSLVRETVALRRSGIIGWRISQSIFQRWAGVATATAVTAAGSGSYAVVDIRRQDALLLAARNLG